MVRPSYKETRLFLPKRGREHCSSKVEDGHDQSVPRIVPLVFGGGGLFRSSWCSGGHWETQKMLGLNSAMQEFVHWKNIAMQAFVLKRTSPVIQFPLAALNRSMSLTYLSPHFQSKCHWSVEVAKGHQLASTSTLGSGTPAAQLGIHFFGSSAKVFGDVNLRSQQRPGICRLGHTPQLERVEAT